jgi:hypothetical protein
MKFDNLVDEFIKLFPANTKSHGKMVKASERQFTEHGGYTRGMVLKHLNGVEGLGLSPILEDSTASWGVIDIDNHKNKDKDVDLIGIEQKIKAHNFPLVLCRSKSGGAHLYLFCKSQVSAKQIIRILKNWASILSIEDTDCIFPKQMKLNETMLASWINLPYFDYSKTSRYATLDGNPIALHEFIELAKSKATSQEDLNGYFGDLHLDAPPCIQKAITEGIQNGYRNDAVYHLMVYNKKRDLKLSADLTREMVLNHFESQPPRNEVEATIKSASQPHAGYLCTKEPWAGWCDRAMCLRSKFGISDRQASNLSFDNLPEISTLVKFDNGHVGGESAYKITVNGVELPVTIRELLEYNLFRVIVIDRLGIKMPISIKPVVWNELIGTLLENRRVETAPEGVGLNGIIRDKLIEFINLADGSGDAQRENVMNGRPVYFNRDDGKHFIAFKGWAFEKHLKREKVDISRLGTPLWQICTMYLKVFVNKRVRISSTAITTVWGVYAEDYYKPKERVAPDFDTGY